MGIKLANPKSKSKVAKRNKKPYHKEVNVQTFETKKMIATYDTNIQNLNKQLGKLHRKNCELENKIGELELLLELNSYASQRLNRDETLGAIQKLFVKTFRLDEYLLLLRTGTDNQLEIASHYGIDLDGKVWIKIEKDNKILHNVFKKGESVYISNLTKNQHVDMFSINGSGGSLLSLPLISEHDSIIGILNLDRKGEGSFLQSEIEFFQLMATHAAGVIDKSILFHNTQELAYNDALTGIFNRRYFDQRFSREVLRARRYSRSLSVLMIDIDYFKKYNDTYGHLMGDRVLQKVAQVLEDKLRRADILCRYGGEEFVVMLPEIDMENARIVAEKLRKTIMANTQLDDSQMPNKHVTISVGVASLPESGNEEEILLGMADKAMYKAKETGRNKVCLSSDL